VTRIVPFIFNWRGQFENARRTEEALAAELGQVIVINSDDHCSQPGWINVGDESYFTAQFLHAMDMFDGDVLLHVQADASYLHWRRLIDDALRHLEHYRWGVYAPHVDFTNWNPGFADVDQVRFRDPQLRLVACTDCTCWFIHRDIVDQMRALRPLFAAGRLGMGIDMTACALSYLDRRPVLRDYSHVVDHPRSRGYDTTEARAELASFLARAPSPLGLVLGQILRRRNDLPAWLATARAQPMEIVR
jgi:hypothetical protein